MKLGQRGFSAVEIVLVIVVVGLLGVVGWLVYDRQSSSDVSESVSTSETSTSEEKAQDDTKDNEQIQPAEVTSGWAEFSPNSKTYAIKLPDGWTFQHQDDECDCLFSKTMEYKEATMATVEKVQGGRDGIVGLFVTVDDKDMSKDRFGEFQIQGSINVSTLTGTKYYYEQTTEPEGIGLDKGSKQYAYYFVKNGKGIYISYSVTPDMVSDIELIETVVSTLR